MSRIENDAFYTPDDVAMACVEDFYKEMPEYIDKTVVEPSAGNGSFLRAFDKIGVKYEAYDLNPQADNIIQADYLSTELDLTGKVVLGNPPYGLRNKLSKAFIKRSFEQGAEAVGFLLFGGILSHKHLKSIGYKVEYFKRLEAIDFIDKDGKVVLKSKGLFNVVFVVWGKEELQPITKNIVEYGTPENWEYYYNYSGFKKRGDNCFVIKRDVKSSFYRITSDPNRDTYIVNINGDFTADMYKKLSWISTCTGRITPNTINYNLSYPELNKGWLK